MSFLTPLYPRPLSFPATCSITFPPYLVLADGGGERGCLLQVGEETQDPVGGHSGERDAGWTGNHHSCTHCTCRPFSAQNCSAGKPRLPFLKQTLLSPSNPVGSPKVGGALGVDFLQVLCEQSGSLKTSKSASFWWPNLTRFCKILH